MYFLGAYIAFVARCAYVAELGEDNKDKKFKTALKEILVSLLLAAIWPMTLGAIIGINLAKHETTKEWIRRRRAE